MIKIINLKLSWDFILDKDVIASKTDYYLLCHIPKIINEAFIFDGWRIRSATVSIGVSTYILPLSNEIDVKDNIYEIINKEKT